MNWPDPDLLEEEWNQSGVPWSELYYGRNYKKLQEAKSRWDPHQVFNHVLSVEPG
jgi:aclacinomycin oxidase